MLTVTKVGCQISLSDMTQPDPSNQSVTYNSSKTIEVYHLNNVEFLLGVHQSFYGNQITPHLPASIGALYVMMSYWPSANFLDFYSAQPSPRMKWHSASIYRES